MLKLAEKIQRFSSKSFRIVSKKLTSILKNCDFISAKHATVYFQMAGIAELVLGPEDYKITKVIGRGTTAVVSLGEFTKGGVREMVAVKEIQAEVAKDLESEEHQRQFVRELQLLAELRHGGVLRIVGFELGNPEKGILPKVLTQFMPRGTLGQAVYRELEKNPLVKWNCLTKAKCVFGIAETMRFVHEKNVIHRDLKLENVFLNEDFEPVIGDFGCAKLFSSSVDNILKAGTSLYLAPEVWNSGSYGKEVDVFSYGVCLRMMFAMDMILDDDVREVKAICTFMCRIMSGSRLRRPRSISDFYWDLIVRCWDGDPSRRMTFASIVEHLKEHRKEYAMTDDPVVLEALEAYEKRLYESGMTLAQRFASAN
jgi:serine/threonine protein kinase